jgi:hypothetical protein
MKRNFLFVLILVLIADFQSFAKSHPIASMPFEMVGSYVVVKVKINISNQTKPNRTELLLICSNITLPELKFLK